MNIADRLFGDDSWTQRTKRVHRFTKEELSTVTLRFLPIPCRHVLRHRIPKDAVLNVIIIPAFARFANYYRQFGFPIDFLQIQEMHAHARAFQSSGRVHDLLGTQYNVVIVSFTTIAKLLHKETTTNMEIWTNMRIKSIPLICVDSDSSGKP